MANRSVTVDAEFADLCPSLTSDEHTLLENSLKAEGCRDPIIAWDAPGFPIIDGHNRYYICLDNEINFGVALKKFTDRNAVTNWIIRNQLGRRNVSDEQRSYLRGKLCQHMERHPHPQSGEGVDSVSTRPSIAYSACEQIAVSQGVTERTVRRNKKFADAVDSLSAKSTALANAAKSGQIPKNAVAAVAALPAASVKKIEKLNGKDRTEAIAAVKSESHRPPEKEATTADTAKAQVEVWQKAIGRWLGTSVSIDELRSQFPGQRGDDVLRLAKELYESLGRWSKEIH